MTIKNLQNGSDIRGVALDTNPKEAVNLGELESQLIAISFIKLLSEKLEKAPNSLKVALGRDSRISGPTLLNTMAKTMSNLGVKVFDCGLCSTPAMFMSTKFEKIMADGAIMITASHLPSNRNGFKFFTEAGGLNKEDISAILNYADEHYKENNKASNEKELIPNGSDKESSGNEVYKNIEEYQLIDEYSNHLKNIIKNALNEGDLPLKNLHIVVDAGNGAGGFYATKVLASLGANVEGSLFLDPDGTFPNHIPNPEDKSAMQAISKAVLDSKADLGIIFDTDVDRSSAVSKDGSELSRNHIIGLAASLIAKDYPNTTVVTDSITSDFLTEFLEKKLNLKHLRYMRGYKNVINKAIELNSENLDCQLAIETSGHAALKENYFLDDGAYLATKIVIEAAKLKKDGLDIYHLVSDLGSPLESEEIRLPILTKDFSAYGDGILAWIKAWVNAEDCVGKQIDIENPSSPCTMCHCGASLDEPNFEGVKIRFDKDNGDGWALIRKSLHDPIMPINIESNCVGGVKQIKTKLKNFLIQFKDLDSNKL